MLLTDLQKKAILPYTRTNPDLEMTADDILNLLRLVCPNPVASLSAPTQRQPLNLETIRPRTSPPLKTNKSTPWKRRPSAVASSIGHQNDLQQILSLEQPTEENQQLIENVKKKTRNL